jgi:hypothetical protein
MNISRWITLTFIGSSVGFAQIAEEGPLRVGIKFGAQLTESFNSVPGFNAGDVSRLKIGPTVEMTFNEFFGAEANALYKQLRFDALLPASATQPLSVSTTNGHVLDFPLLMKWRPVGRRYFSPYASGGVTLRYLNTNEEIRSFAGEDRTASFDRSFAQDSSFNAGFTLSGGIEFDPGERVRLAPELRWTVWGRDNFSSGPTIGTSNESFDYQNNQIELLLGVTF